MKIVLGSLPFYWRIRKRPNPSLTVRNRDLTFTEQVAKVAPTMGSNIQGAPVLSGTEIRFENRVAVVPDKA